MAFAATLLVSFLGLTFAAGRRRRRRRLQLRGGRVFFGDRWWRPDELVAYIARESGVEFDHETIAREVEEHGVSAVEPYLMAMLDVLTMENIEHLEAQPRTPKLYDAGVRYEVERPGEERWQNIRSLYRTRRGDCEDLVAARRGELAIAGVATRSRWTKQILPNGSILYHVTVLYDDGRIEDPSIILGMGPAQREAA